jgi:hypothetical protein
MQEHPFFIIVFGPNGPEIVAKGMDDEAVELLKHLLILVAEDDIIDERITQQ